MSSTVLWVQDVSVSFNGLRALDSVAMHVDRGEVVGLIGPNGAGKTTLFNVISGLQPASSGRVVLNGKDVTSLGAHKRAAMGLRRSFQHLGLVRTETVRFNVEASQRLARGFNDRDVVLRPWRWVAEERIVRHRSIEVLDSFGLTQVMDEVVSTLPFATGRLVELATVMSASPQLLLLDEPTTGLDADEMAHLKTVVHDARASGYTLIIIAHDVKFVTSLCDRVYALAAGSILAEGTPANVVAHPDVVKSYLGASA